MGKIFFCWVPNLSFEFIGYGQYFFYSSLDMIWSFIGNGQFFFSKKDYKLLARANVIFLLSNGIKKIGHGQV